MIGFYDYTVVVTYISLVSSILGMFCAIDGKLTLAQYPVWLFPDCVICLMER